MLAMLSWTFDESDSAKSIPKTILVYLFRYAASEFTPFDLAVQGPMFSCFLGCAGGGSPREGYGCAFQIAVARFELF
jgi:hypothetical protein